LQTLVLPHKLRAGETAWLEVKAGAIPHRAEIEGAYHDEAWHPCL
jgi:hypothetical protein